MKTDWDYTSLADAYLKRPDYANAAIDATLAVARADSGARICDVGAGVAHLTLMLAVRGMSVAAVEPNMAMRSNGIKRTEHLANVTWRDGTGEETGEASSSYDMVTFGSSFNVCDRSRALAESARILKPHGWFCCMWNHRQLDDPVQAGIESIIKQEVPGYGYGARREDQTAVIDASGLFGPVLHLSSRVVHRQSIEECVQAWRSHATLERQAASAFGGVVARIDGSLQGLGVPAIDVPYDTTIWMARLR